MKKTLFFISGPGYWRPRWTYWAAWLWGLCMMPLGGLGIFAWLILLVLGISSYHDSRNEEVTQDFDDDDEPDPDLID